MEWCSSPTCIHYRSGRAAESYFSASSSNPWQDICRVHFSIPTASKSEKWPSQFRGNIKGSWQKSYILLPFPSRFAILIPLKSVGALLNRPNITNVAFKMEWTQLDYSQTHWKPKILLGYRGILILKRHLKLQRLGHFTQNPGCVQMRWQHCYCAC